MKREKKIRPYVPSRRKGDDLKTITFNDKILENFRKDWMQEAALPPLHNLEFIINPDGTIRRFDE